ncbi:MAG: transposase [Candidatus Azotimanducaceae bacterium]|jgi:transposase
MTLAPDQLPNDPAKLKALLLKQQASAEKREASLMRRINSLLETLRLEKHRRFGASSEKAPGQAALFDEPEHEAVLAPSAATVQASSEPKIQPARPSRTPLPQDLPRVRQVEVLPAEELICECGCQLEEIGEDISEQLDIIPARVQVIQHVRKKYACKNCEEAIKSAPRPNTLLPKAIASANTMAYIITSKYADGLPLYRLSEILKRYGVDLSRQTLSASVLKTAQLVDPMIEQMLPQLHAGPVLHMDETRVQVLKEPGRAAQSQSYMWVQRGGPPDKPIIHFTYEPSRAASVPAQLLSGYEGVLMTDGYQPYRQVAAQQQLTHLCCWAHVRRKFKEAMKAQPKGKTGKADMGLHFIAKLYGIEKREKTSDAATRQLARATEASPVLEQFKKWLDTTLTQIPPKSATGRAVNYALEYWPELNQYGENGDWPIDNNPAENAIRPFVIGRKNWLFSDSQRGAKASANLYSLIETAKANDREPYRYLCWLFERLATADLGDCESLMPWNMPKFAGVVC